MTKIEDAARQLAQQSFNRKPPKETDAMRDLRRAKEREAEKIEHLRALRLQKEEADKAAAAEKAAAEKPKARGKTKASGPKEGQE